MMMDIDHQIDDEEKDFMDVLSYTGIRLDQRSGGVLSRKLQGIPVKIVREAIDLLRDSSRRSISASDIEIMVRKIAARGVNTKPEGCGKCCDGFVYYSKPHAKNNLTYEYAARCGCDLGSLLSLKIPHYSEVRA